MFYVSLYKGFHSKRCRKRRKTTRSEELAKQRILLSKEIGSVQEFINEIKKWKQEFQERIACNLYLKDFNTGTMAALINVMVLIGVVSSQSRADW
jgi:hypothetical protein